MAEHRPGRARIESYWTPPRLSPDTLAFLQYTPGRPELLRRQGVARQPAATTSGRSRPFGHTSDDVIGLAAALSRHGLIGNILQPLYGAPCIVMSPVHFLQKPVRWLSAITKHRATTSGGPNFCTNSVSGRLTDAQLADLDLCSWSVAFNGAEPVRGNYWSAFL
ncbi:MAG: hypothetical protein MRJ92_08800 [Nitrospira sp.]|nr:hypothetical protein [Nitrospira sp.]